MSESKKVAEFKQEVERLKAAGKLPTLERLLEVIAETRAEFRPKILAARAEQKTGGTFSKTAIIRNLIDDAKEST
jgi:hypothetical protein